MSKINDGGPAFAAGAANEQKGWAQEGMSLRDWFAGQAIGSAMSSANAHKICPSAATVPEEYFAGKAYAIADAMLRARSESGQ